MSKKPTELEAAALASSWSTAQQAALYHIHLAQQARKDEQEALKKKEKKEEKKMKEMARPEDVDGGEIVDGWAAIKLFEKFLPKRNKKEKKESKKDQKGKSK
ncbi:hypothetical protein C348_05879 [Cryptococcus neoformans Gb118]|nr:hypothetical protein C350_05638 [Cryptococcus neoformans var. grubii MW-RSA36]OXL05759.1 hypothetical protein C348_05879 [Cryptococcus neoformans var. grubii Gb118]